MKRIKTNAIFKINPICPYCNKQLEIEVCFMEKPDKIEIHPVESILRGFWKKFVNGEGFTSDISVKCTNCFKIFMINEVDF